MQLLVVFGKGLVSMPNDQTPPAENGFVDVTGAFGLDGREPATQPPPRTTGKAKAYGTRTETDTVASHAARLGMPAQDKDAVFITGNGGETVPTEPDLHAFQTIVRQSPELLAAQASEVRLRQTSMISNDALVLGVEATASNAASNAMERDMMHQYAALESIGMELLLVGKKFMVTITPWQTEERQQLQSIEATRCFTAAAKVLLAAQGAARTLKYLRDGGKQTVTVQHVTVEAGGQAVVAGAIKPRRRRP